MKVKVPCLGLCTNPQFVEIDLGDLDVRERLTKIGCTLPPEPKQVEPVEFAIKYGTIIPCGDSTYAAAQIYDSPTAMELSQQLVIQANFAKRFWDVYCNHDPLQMPYWVESLGKDLKAQLKGE